VTLIEPDVALTAGHCLASNAQNGQPLWLRAVVTFDRADSLDESKCIDVAADGSPPDRPPLHGALYVRRGRPGHPGYRPHFPCQRGPGITPSKLAPRNTIESVERLQNIFDVSTPMAFAGYGATDYNDFDRGPARSGGVHREHNALGGGSLNLLPFQVPEREPILDQRFTSLSHITDHRLVVHRSPIERRLLVRRGHTPSNLNWKFGGAARI
jgi:hypothetical protein